jgi:hypothetical protein
MLPVNFGILLHCPEMQYYLCSSPVRECITGNHAFTDDSSTIICRRNCRSLTSQ